MLSKYRAGRVPAPREAKGDSEVRDLVARVIASYRTHFDDYNFSRGLENVWELIARVNKYIVENEPWALAEKQDEHSRARLATVLYTSAEALRIVTALAHPVIPEATAKIWTQLGLGEIGQDAVRAQRPT